MNQSPSLVQLKMVKLEHGTVVLSYCTCLEKFNLDLAGLNDSTVHFVVSMHKTITGNVVP